MDSGILVGRWVQSGCEGGGDERCRYRLTSQRLQSASGRGPDGQTTNGRRRWPHAGSLFSFPCGERATEPRGRERQRGRGQEGHLGGRARTKREGRLFSSPATHGAVKLRLQAQASGPRGQPRGFRLGLGPTALCISSSRWRNPQFGLPLHCCLWWCHSRGRADEMGSGRRTAGVAPRSVATAGLFLSIPPA